MLYNEILPAVHFRSSTIASYCKIKLLQQSINCNFDRFCKKFKIMKGLIFILCLCVAITAIAGSWIDETSEKIKDSYSLPTTEVQNCINNSNMTYIDSLVLDKLFSGDLDTSDDEDSALRVGCLLACVFQKKEWLDGTHMNLEKLKSDMSHKLTNPAKQNRIMDTCIDQVKDLTNECEFMLKLMRCTIVEENLDRNRL